MCLCVSVCVPACAMDQRRRCAVAFTPPPHPHPFPPPFLFVYLFRFSSRRPRRNFSSITRKILSPPPPLGDYNGPTGRSVTSQHGRCSLFTLSVLHLHTYLLSGVRPRCAVKHACYLSDSRLLFLSFSKMFIGGLSWQTTQGELSRTLLHAVQMKASCSLSGAHFTHFPALLTPKFAVNS